MPSRPCAASASTRSGLLNAQHPSIPPLRSTTSTDPLRPHQTCDLKPTPLPPPHPRPATFLPSLLLPAVDAGPTPTVARLNPGGGSTFAFPPVAQSSNGNEHEGSSEEAEVRKAALESITTLSESKPVMLKSMKGWVKIVVRGCVENMGEIPEEDTETWLDAEVGPAFLSCSSAFAVLTAPVAHVIEYVPHLLLCVALRHSFSSCADWSSRCSTTHIHECDTRRASACTSPHLVLLPTLTLMVTRTRDSGQLCTDLEKRTACVIGLRDAVGLC